MSLHSLFSPPSVGVSPDPSGDLADRLRTPEGPALLRQMLQQLDNMQARLRQQAGQGANSATFDQLQATLRAVDAARNILLRLPVRSDNSFDSPLVQAPRASTRSTP